MTGGDCCADGKIAAGSTSDADGTGITKCKRAAEPAGTGKTKCKRAAEPAGAGKTDDKERSGREPPGGRGST